MIDKLKTALRDIGYSEEEFARTNVLHSAEEQVSRIMEEQEVTEDRAINFVVYGRYDL